MNAGKLLCHICGFLQAYLVYNPVDVRQALRRDRWRVLVENEDKCGKTAKSSLKNESINVQKCGDVQRVEDKKWRWGKEGA